MNASKVLGQIMQQASSVQQQGGTGRSGGGGGFDVNQMLGSLSSRLGGGKHKGTDQGGGGLDVSSLLGGGALGMLLGSKRGRSMGGKALKYGALAGIGALAWKAYQNYQGSQAGQTDQATEGKPLEQLQGEAQEQRGLEILQAMIMAARADGHVDAEERARLTGEIEKLGADDELHAWIEEQFDTPLDAQRLARQADSPQARREIYLVSATMIDDQNAMERAWLDDLAKALNLEPELAAELERQVQEQAPH